MTCVKEASGSSRHDDPILRLRTATQSDGKWKDGASVTFVAVNCVSHAVARTQHVSLLASRIAWTNPLDHVQGGHCLLGKAAGTGDAEQSAVP